VKTKKRAQGQSVKKKKKRGGGVIETTKILNQKCITKVIEGD
jgi:hypothetical protein